MIRINIFFCLIEFITRLIYSSTNCIFCINLKAIVAELSNFAVLRPTHLAGNVLVLR